MDTTRPAITQLIDTSTYVGAHIATYPLNLAREMIYHAIISKPCLAKTYKSLTGLNPKESPVLANKQISVSMHKTIRYLSLLRAASCVVSISLGSLTPMGQLTTAVFWLYIYQINNRAENIISERKNGWRLIK